MSDETATATKPKVQRTPQTMLLVSPETDGEGNITNFRVVKQPPLSGDKHRRDDYHRAVRGVLEKAENEELLKEYNNAPLTVVSFPEPKTLKVEVKETVVRKTVINEV